MLKVCFLTSGGGGNMKFMHLAKQLNKLDNFELSVIADRPCSAVTFAEEHHIYAKTIQYKRTQKEALQNLLSEIDPDIIVTTWAKIIDEETVEKYRGKMINLHYSLLPAFAGQMGTEPIENAYRQNCQYIGVTCHYVNEDVDMGTIISQAVITTDRPIENAIEEIFRKGCLILLNSIMIAGEERIIEKTDTDNFQFSPKLTFDEHIFDQTFWKELASL